MPIIQIDWQELKEKFADVTAFYVFTHRQASLLLSLAEQLSWEKTFRDWGYDFGDKDALDLEIDDLRNNLMSPVNIIDIIELIDDVEDLLKDIRDATGGCCIDEDVTDGVQYTDAVEDGVGSVPQSIIDAGYATDAADWAGFADYKCMIAHQAIYTLETRLRVAAPWFGIGAGFTAILGSLAAIISAFFPTPAAPAAVIALGIIAAVAVTATLYKGLSDLGEDAIIALADDVSALHDLLACSIYVADGSENAITALNTQIDDSFNVAEALVLKSLNVGPTIRALYAGRYDQISVAQELADRGYDVDDYSCVCDVLEEGQLISNPEWDNGTEGWTLDPTWWPNWLATSDVSPTGETGVIRSKEWGGSGMPHGAMRSPNFVIPAGVTEVWAEVRLRNSSSLSWTGQCELVRASDDVIIATRTQPYGSSNVYQTLQVGSVIAVVPGTQYYLNIWTGFGGPSGRARLSHGKCWYAI